MTLTLSPSCTSTSRNDRYVKDIILITENALSLSRAVKYSFICDFWKGLVASSTQY